MDSFSICKWFIDFARDRGIAWGMADVFAGWDISKQLSCDKKTDYNRGLKMTPHLSAICVTQRPAFPEDSLMLLARCYAHISVHKFGPPHLSISFMLAWAGL